jgi:hypothetical protein
MGAASAIDVVFASESSGRLAGLSPSPSSASHKRFNLTTAGIVPVPNGAQLMVGGRF